MSHKGPAVVVLIVSGVVCLLRFAITCSFRHLNIQGLFYPTKGVGGNAFSDLQVRQRRRPTGKKGPRSDWGAMKTSFDIVNYLAGMKNSILDPTDESSNHKLHEGPQVRCFRPVSAILINHHHSNNRGVLSYLFEVLYHFVVCSNVTSHHAFLYFLLCFARSRI